MPHASKNYQNSRTVETNVPHIHVHRETAVEGMTRLELEYISSAYIIFLLVLGFVSCLRDLVGERHEEDEE